MEYTKQQIEVTRQREVLICNKCNTEIHQSGGDSFGYVYFSCICTEWKSKNKRLGSIGYYDGGGIEPDETKKVTVKKMKKKRKKRFERSKKKHGIIDR